jgi:hypothetical protein
MAKSLLEAIRERAQKQARLGYGIATADKYARTILECQGVEHCEKLFGGLDREGLLKEAGEKLVYSNEDMIVEAKQASGEFEDILPEGVEAPKNTLMVFRHVLTTPRKDRDGDILRTGGAEVDEKMLLLWQHIHTLPIGKLLAIETHNSKTLRNISCIVDMNELAHDSAVMIDNGMGRFSHGFRALEFETLKAEPGETNGPPGFDVKRFEIMEESLVSVPSNIDAETEDILLSLTSQKRLKSEPVLKYVETHCKQDGTVSVPGVEMPTKAGQLHLKFAGVDIAITQPEPENKSPCSCETPEEKTFDDGEPEIEKSSTRLPPGSLEGSYEWTETRLRQSAHRFLDLQAVDLNARFVWVAGTFASNAIICAEHERSNVPDEFVYYKADWEMKDGAPNFKGEPTAIEVSVSLDEIRSLSPLTKDKIPQTEKVGRTLSRANMQKLQAVHDDLKEMGGSDNLTRGQHAMCERCAKTLDEVIRSATPDEDPEGEAGAKPEKKLAEVLLHLYEADQEQFVKARQAIEAVLATRDRDARTKEYTRLT